MENLILFIPHSSAHIPFFDGFDLCLIEKEIRLLTDWDTDKIFEIPNTTKLVCGFSRIFCDVERLPDEMEPMYKFGRGFFYTHTDDGRVLRKDINGIKSKIFNEYYQKHQSLLKYSVEKDLIKHNQVLIIDCHSFSDIPFKTDLNKNTCRPDICIGTDPFHTPKDLSNFFISFFENSGYIVLENSPYSGTIVPLEFYKKDFRVKSIMIEINRKIYVDTKGNSIKERIVELNGKIRKLIKGIVIGSED